MARGGAGHGKLKRPSVVLKDARAPLARRGDMYDIQLSPEKSSTHVLPSPKQRGPTERYQKRKPGRVGPRQQQDDNVAAPYIASSPPSTAGTKKPTEAQQGQRAASSLPKAVSRTALPPYQAPEDVPLTHHLSDGRPRCGAVMYRYDKRTGPHYQQCSLHSTERIQGKLHCARHANNHAALRCIEVVESDGTLSRCHRVATLDTLHGAHCAAHDNTSYSSDIHSTTKDTTERQNKEMQAGREDPPTELVTSKRKLTAKSSHGTSCKPQKSRRLGAQRRTTIQETSEQPASGQGKPTSEQDVMSQITNGSETSSALPTDLHAEATGDIESPRSPSPRPSQTGQTNEVWSNGMAARTSTNSVPQHKSVSTVRQDEAHSKEDEDDHMQMPAALSVIFEFLTFEERAGSCRTELGLSIKRLCEKSCQAIGKYNDLVEIISINDAVRNSLKQIGSDVTEDDQRSFKSDAYSFLFRALTLYLKAVYTCLYTGFDAVAESLDATRVLCALIRAILALKDTVAKWKVSIYQRYKGDRIIMDVDSSLIVPLRKVYKIFHDKVGQLEAQERRRQDYRNLQREVSEEAKQDQQRSEFEAARKARWRRWQNLHIARMQCEPDPRRRRKLVIVQVGDSEEKDANGIRFERLPVFKSRSIPPLHWATTRPEEPVWTVQEELTLLGGLQKFAGMSECI